MPAITGTRPRACSTATRMISQCSSTVDRRRFAGRADDADAVGAFGDVPVDQAAQRVVVDAAVVVHRRDERDDAASNGFHVALSWNRAILAGRADVRPPGRQRAAPGDRGGRLAHGRHALDEARRGSRRKPSS